MTNGNQQDRQAFLRTFGKRQGRKLNRTKQQYLQETLSRFLLHDSRGSPNPSDRKENKRYDRQERMADKAATKSWEFQDIWGQACNKDDKKILEIGFGSGEHMLQRLCRTNCYFIGSEVYSNGIASCISEMVRSEKVDDLQNRLRLYPDDIRLLLPALADNLFDEVAILFPDPWPKKRHWKRRLLQVPFLDSIARVLKRGGELQIASDHEGVMQWMLEQLMLAGWQRLGGTWSSDNLQHYRIFPEGWTTTRYQAKALKEGRESYFVRALKDGKA